MPQKEPQTPTMDDHEIKRKVESIAGKNARVIDCEKKSSFVSEETLLINGIPVKLEGKAGDRIKEALKSGQPPPVELLSEILVQAGIEKNPVQLETTMTVKSSTKTSELSTLSKHGKVIDEKLKEFEEEDEIQSASVEIWERDSDQAQKLKKTFEDFRTNMEPFIAPKPLPRTFTPDRTPPKTPQSQQSPTTPTGNSSPSGKANPPAAAPTPTFNLSNVTNFNNIIEANNNKQQYYNHHHQFNKQQRPSEPPPRIPSLLKPLKLNKPIPPPKPKSKQVADVLRREKNFELPVRVVYETFI